MANKGERGGDGGLICSANESDSARLTRPEHRSYRTFYWRAAADADAGDDDGFLRVLGMLVTPK